MSYDFLSPNIFKKESFSSEEAIKRGLVDRIPDQFIVVDSTNKYEVFAVEYLNELFGLMMANSVSDIHLESLESGHICRVRKDGDLHKYGRLLSDQEFNFIRKKIYSRSLIDEALAKQMPIDARGWLKYDAKLDLRISSTPTVLGFTIVIRLLDQSNSGRQLSTVEMSSSVREATLDMINSAYGLILITGPTGSGKTSTLYSFLNEINSIKRKVFTVEDPVEYTINGVQHINVGKNITFAKALKSALRQDPDVILIGEIRDKETAKIAVEAAQTGHLVLSTLHTNSSIGAISRLMELGVDPSHINETLIAVSAQRLVRKCKDVRNVDTPTDQEKDWLKKNGYSNMVNKSFGRGYNKKNYSGRLPIIEFLVIDDEIRENISSGNISTIYNIARKQKQYEPLTEAALRLANEGKTSLEEVISITKSKTSYGTEGLLLGDRLLVLGYITEYQLAFAKSIQKSATGIHRKKLSQIILDLNYCSLEQMNEVMDAPDA
ncbi:type II/IV secretion system protein [Acinetobacter sp. ANC 5380]|uniref:Type II/IV secretion system protein n=1 Tax=Acinetobacter terrae TaxID=2731247 RepID=A0A7Y2WCA1_9GAMM|nr:GspE/PulE family protein [Acinetobacter terrae]NNH79207.1 type II/IV secretion system protein [Acinetobacter terrae]